jgi:hypothetical protein
MKAYLIFSLMLFSSVANAQNWEVYYQNDSVIVEYALGTYEVPSHNRKHERLIFKYTNILSSPVTLSFERSVAYDNVDLGVSPERMFTVELSPNESKLYSDTTKFDKTFYIFSKDINNTIKRKLSAFELKNFNISVQ